jgi:hypothetical protein
MHMALNGRFYRAFAAVLAALALTGIGAKAPAVAQSRPAPSARHTTEKLDAVTRRAVANALAEDLARDYAYATTGEKMATAIKARLAAGAYNGIESTVAFASALTADVHAVAPDKHFRVWFSDRAGPRIPSSPAIAHAMMAGMKKMNGAISRVEILEGNIGYMEVNGMPPAPIAKAAIAAAFAFLHNTDALIIDLRANGGGDPETVAFYMSYLSSKAPHIVNHFHWRNPERVTATSTTQLGRLSYGSQKPVFCLTSRRTFSGGEELAYDIQAFKRGVIVGERTGGGANPSDLESLGNGFWALIPDGFVVNPETGGNWEGRGVVPGVHTPADLALLAAERLAIIRLEARSIDPGERVAFESVGQELAMREAALEGRAVPTLEPAQVVGAYRAAFGGLGPAPGGASLTDVTQRGGKLLITAGVPNMPPVRLVAEGRNVYHLSGYPSDFTAVFSRSQSGEVQLVLYLNFWPAAIMRRVTIP